MSNGRRLWTVCRREGCSKALRSDNHSGYCRAHHRLGGTCMRCLRPCSTGWRRCDKCRALRRKETARVVAPCTAPGCTKRVHSKSGMCHAHYMTGGGTCTATGCSTPVMFGSKTMLCRAHLFLSRKLRRYAAQESA